MFDWILSITVGAILAFVMGFYLVMLGVSLSSTIAVCALVLGYSAAVAALLFDDR